MLVTWLSGSQILGATQISITSWGGGDSYVICVNVTLVTLFMKCKTKITYINQCYSPSLTNWLPRSLPLARSTEKRAWVWGCSSREAETLSPCYGGCRIARKSRAGKHGQLVRVFTLKGSSNLQLFNSFYKLHCYRGREEFIAFFYYCTVRVRGLVILKIVIKYVHPI